MLWTRSTAIISWTLLALAPLWASGASVPTPIHDELTPKPQQFWPKPEDGPEGDRNASAGAIRELEVGEFNNLERDIEYALETKERLPDGIFVLESIVHEIFDGVRNHGSSEDAAMEPIKRWKASRPDSSAAPIVEAITWRALAWAARGNTVVSAVNPAGADLFETRSMLAADVLMDSKGRSSINPLWYLEMQQAGRDLHWDRSRVEDILKEGMSRFPEFIALPSEMVVYLSPKWYGDYDQERTFIETTVAAAPKETQAELYTRLYWKLQDTMGLSSSDVFAATGASWARMKQGFEDMMARYPESRWNQNHYAAWACVAGDKPTYAKARDGLQTTVYDAAWFASDPIQGCDRRLGYTQSGPGTLPSSGYKQLAKPLVSDGPASDHWIGGRYLWLFETQAFDELDRSLTEAATRLDQSDDGSFRVYTAGQYLGTYFVYFASSASAIESALSDWHRRMPHSTQEPIVESIYWRCMGESLRRQNPARDDSEEAALLFRERLLKAQAALTASRDRSRSSPLWYTEQIQVGRDLGWPLERLLKVYKEGMSRYPAYGPLEWQMAVSQLPMWGGTYEQVEQFAEAQAMTAGPELGAERYARIYWNLSRRDQCADKNICDIFETTMVSWNHMRQGFEAMLRRYPASLWNTSNFAMFACLAKDKEAYGKIRAKLGQDAFVSLWPTNASQEVCDHALLTPL